MFFKEKNSAGTKERADALKRRWIAEVLKRNTNTADAEYEGFQNISIRRPALCATVYG